MKVGDLVVIDTGNPADDCNDLLGVVIKINHHDVFVSVPTHDTRWYLSRHLRVVQ